MPDGVKKPFSPFKHPAAPQASAGNSSAPTPAGASPFQPAAGRPAQQNQIAGSSPFGLSPRPPFINPLTRQPSSGSGTSTGAKPNLLGGLARPPLRAPPTFKPPPLSKPFVPPQARHDITNVQPAITDPPAVPTRPFSTPPTAGRSNQSFVGIGSSAGGAAPGLINPAPAPSGGNKAGGWSPATSAPSAKASAGPSRAFVKPGAVRKPGKPEIVVSSSSGGHADGDEDFFGSIASPPAGAVYL